MAVNLATKYSGKIAAKFKDSTFLTGKVSTDYDFIGVKSITINTPLTQAPGTYDRTATNAPRFGALAEMQDTIQELSLTKEPSFNIAIDRGNYEDQMLLKKAGEMLQLQIEEQMTPYYEKYALEQWAKNAGTIASVSAPTNGTFFGMLQTARSAFVNAKAPKDKLYCIVGTTYYTKLAQTATFLALEKLGTEAHETGVVGKCAGFKMIEVPDDYMPDNVYFICWTPRSVLAPHKIKTNRILTDHPDVDGAVLQGRNYFDAFVIGARANGVYAAALSTKVCAAPAIATAADSPVAVGDFSSTTEGVTFKYTTDGTDPRYSKSAVVGDASAVTDVGTVIKCYCYKDGLYASGVTTATIPESAE